MLHSLEPKRFVASQRLRAPSECPECRKHFFYGDGAMSLAHYRETATGDVKQGLLCFCSTACLLLWEHPKMLGLMQ